jgi:hypothetical protein
LTAAAAWPPSGLAAGAPDCSAAANARRRGAPAAPGGLRLLMKPARAWWAAPAPGAGMACCGCWRTAPPCHAARRSPRSYPGASAPGRSSGAKLTSSAAGWRMAGCCGCGGGSWGSLRLLLLLALCMPPAAAAPAACSPAGGGAAAVAAAAAAAGRAAGAAAAAAGAGGAAGCTASPPPRCCCCCCCCCCC